MKKGLKVHCIISEGWWERFKSRHPLITLTMAAPLSYAMAMATDKEPLDSTFTPNLQAKDLSMFFDSTNEVNVSRSYSESNLNHDVSFSPDSTDQSTCVFPLSQF